MYSSRAQVSRNPTRVLRHLKEGPGPMLPNILLSLSKLCEYLGPDGNLWNSILSFFKFEAVALWISSTSLMSPFCCLNALQDSFTCHPNGKSTLHCFGFIPSIATKWPMVCVSKLCPLMRDIKTRWSYKWHRSFDDAQHMLCGSMKKVTF